MNSKFSNCLKYKVTQLAPAIFADNMMMLVMDRYDVPWNPTFTTDEYHKNFLCISGLDILLEMDDTICPWYETELDFPDMWHVNEGTLYKFLHSIETSFRRKSDEDAKSHFLFYCTGMIYGALDYYKKGVTSALTVVFLEVYFLACYYSERMNFKCDLISTSTES